MLQRKGCTTQVFYVFLQLTHKRCLNKLVIQLKESKQVKRGADTRPLHLQESFYFSPTSVWLVGDRMFPTTDVVWSCLMVQPLVHLEMIRSYLGWWRFGAVKSKMYLRNHKQILLPFSQFIVLSCLHCPVPLPPGHHAHGILSNWQDEGNLHCHNCSSLLLCTHKEGCVSLRAAKWDKLQLQRGRKPPATAGADFVESLWDPGALMLQPHSLSSALQGFSVLTSC